MTHDSSELFILVESLWRPLRGIGKRDFCVSQSIARLTIKNGGQMQDSMDNDIVLSGKAND